MSILICYDGSPLNHGAPLATIPLPGASVALKR
jgi:hypothetical protein